MVKVNAKARLKEQTMKTKFILAGLFIYSGFLFSQKKITLDECQSMARANYPLINQYQLIDKSKEFTLSNIGKAYLPQVSLNGQATYQSAVTKVPIDFKALNLPVSIQSPNKDQYKATIDVSQIIWDGGNINAQKDISKANADVDKNQVDISLYQIREKINQLYFGILAIDAQLKLLDYLEEDLDSNKKIMVSMYNNQMATESDIYQVDVQILNVEQNRTTQESDKVAYLKMLSVFINNKLDNSVDFEIPQKIDLELSKISRPELNLYDAQRNLTEMQRKSIKAKNMPQLGLFAQGGYGNPGLNMLKNKFDLYAVGGVKFSWNFGNLYTKKNEEQNIAIKQASIKVQEDTFLFNTNLEIDQQYQDLQKINRLLTKDGEIIDLRDKIKKASESKYRNGVSTANDLIQDINAANQARQTKALREIEYLQNIYNYKYLQGN